MAKFFKLQAIDSVTRTTYSWTSTQRDLSDYPGPNTPEELAVVAEFGVVQQPQQPTVTVIPNVSGSYTLDLAAFAGAKKAFLYVTAQATITIASDIQQLGYEFTVLKASIGTYGCSIVFAPALAQQPDDSIAITDITVVATDKAWSRSYVWTGGFFASLMGFSSAPEEPPPVATPASEWGLWHWWDAELSITESSSQVSYWESQESPNPTILGGLNPTSGSRPDYLAPSAVFGRAALLLGGVGEFAALDPADLPASDFTFLHDGTTSWEIVGCVSADDGADATSGRYLWDTSAGTGSGASLRLRARDRIEAQILNANTPVHTVRSSPFLPDTAFFYRVSYDATSDELTIEINDQFPETGSLSGSYDSGPPPATMGIGTRAGGANGLWQGQVTLHTIKQGLADAGLRASQALQMQAEYGVTIQDFVTAIGLATDVNIVVDGDSNSDPTHTSTDQNNWWMQLQNLFVANGYSLDILSENFAVSGSQWTDLAARQVATNAAAKPGRTNIYIGMCSTNDIVNAGADGPTALSSAQSYVDSLVASGVWDYIALMAIPHISDPTHNGHADTYNAGISGLTGVDFTIPRHPSITEGTHYVDAVHWNAAGHALQADQVFSTLLSVLSPPP